jgi:predicted secreted protein
MRNPFQKFAVRRGITALVVGALCFASLAVGLAQEEATPEAVAQTASTGANPGVRIIYPARASEVWGTFPVVGTADVPDLSYYYLEYLPLNDDLSLPDGAPWLPATVAMSEPVEFGALASLDSTQVSDGLYALRLTVNDSEGQTYHDTVTPIRVNNARFTNVIRRLIRDALINGGVQPPETPTPQPTTVPANTDPFVTPEPGTGSVNVRRCDVVDNYSCAIVGYLSEGETAPVLGISSNGSGWYQIQLSSGLIGWVSPTVVIVEGDLGGVPAVAPPAPLPPPATANITLNGIAISGAPTCGVTFNVNVNVANTGNAASSPGTVTLQDVNLGTGEITFTGYGNYPAINPGSNYVVTIPVMTTVYYNQQHELRAYVGSQTVTTQYTLAQGSCGVAPTPAPQPPRTIQVNDSNNGQTVNLKVGDVLVVTLNADLSAGYSWSLSADTLAALQLTSGPTTLSDASVPGAPQRQQWTFTAVAPGQDIVRLTYAQARMAPEQTYQITAAVS